MIKTSTTNQERGHTQGLGKKDLDVEVLFKDSPYKVHMSTKEGDLKLVQNAVAYKVNDDCYLTALNNYRGRIIQKR